MRSSERNDWLLTIWLIFVFPIGLLIMWLRTDWSKTVKWAITSFFVLIAIVAIANSSGNSNNQQQQTTTQSSVSSTPSTPSNSPEPTEAPKTTATPTIPLTLEEKIKEKLNLGKNTKATEAVTSIDTDPTTNKELPGKIVVEISYQMNGTYLDTSWTKRGSWKIDTGIIKDIFPLDSSINGIIMITNVPVTSAYGQDTYSMLDSVTVNRVTFVQINFAKFDSQKLPTIADNYTENHNIK